MYLVYFCVGFVQKYGILSCLDQQNGKDHKCDPWVHMGSELGFSMLPYSHRTVDMWVSKDRE